MSEVKFNLPAAMTAETPKVPEVVTPAVVPEATKAITPEVIAAATVVEGAFAVNERNPSEWIIELDPDNETLIFARCNRTNKIYHGDMEGFNLRLRG